MNGSCHDFEKKKEALRASGYTIYNGPLGRTLDDPCHVNMERRGSKKDGFGYGDWLTNLGGKTANRVIIPAIISPCSYHRLSFSLVMYLPIKRVLIV